MTKFSSTNIFIIVFLQWKPTSLRQRPPKFCSATECPRQCSGSGDKSSFFAMVPYKPSQDCRDSQAGCAPHSFWGAIHPDADVNSAAIV